MRHFLWHIVQRSIQHPSWDWLAVCLDGTFTRDIGGLAIAIGASVCFFRGNEDGLYRWNPEDAGALCDAFCAGIFGLAGAGCLTRTTGRET